jgi:hypothetical protein
MIRSGDRTHVFPMSDAADLDARNSYVRHALRNTRGESNDRATTRVPTTTLNPRARSDSHHKPVPPLDPDAELMHWRTYYHPAPEVLHADERGVTYRVNPNAIGRHLDVHRDFVDLFQFFHDIKPVLDRGRMSTTALSHVLDELEDRYLEDEQVVLDRKLLERLSGRHFLLLATSNQVTALQETHKAGLVPGSIRFKANWARSQTAQMRKRLPNHQKTSTAKQLDWIAEMHVNALRQPTIARRANALERIKKTMLVDTRSQAGAPKHLRRYLPIDPPQGSTAYLNEWSPSTWGLWIANQASSNEGVLILDAS